jgi:hypothetical protein
MNYLPIEGDIFIGEEYWEYKCQVQIRNGEIWDTDIVWAKGAGPDDESLDSNEIIEDLIKEHAENRAWERINDVLAPVSFEEE